MGKAHWSPEEIHASPRPFSAGYCPARLQTRQRGFSASAVVRKLAGYALDVLVGMVPLSQAERVVIPHGGGTSLIFVGRLFGEATILEVAKAYQDLTTFHGQKPPGFLN